MGFFFRHRRKKRKYLLEHVENNHEENTDKCMNCEYVAKQDIDVTNHIEEGHS